MRILILSTSMGMGGADQQILILTRAMRDRGHEVRIVALTPLGPMGLEAQREGIPTDSLDLRKNPGDLARIARLVRMIREWRPDILHTHMAHANLLGRAVRLLAPVRALVSTIHSISDGGRLRMVGYRLTNHLADRVTIISRLAADRYVKIGAVPAGRLEVIPNTVDLERFRPSPEARTAIRTQLGIGDEFVWLAVGRFQPAKDYPTMIAAFADLAHTSTSRLILVGQGPLRGEVERLLRAEGIENRVRLLGVRRDVPDLMCGADGYVLSSAWEGMPVVLLEAAAVGLPVVATRVGGVSEVVEDGVTGSLVPPGDPAALAEAMRGIEALSPDQRVAMGGRGRALVQERYSTGSVMGMWERLYSCLLPAESGGEDGQR
jgi:glycosyltransferase involved in cell wall biosynthesis